MLTLLHLLSAVALLVWGTHIVRTGVMRVFGARLRTVLSSSVEKKPLAFRAATPQPCLSPLLWRRIWWRWPRRW